MNVQLAIGLVFGLTPSYFVLWRTSRRPSKGPLYVLGKRTHFRGIEWGSGSGLREELPRKRRRGGSLSQRCASLIEAGHYVDGPDSVCPVGPVLVDCRTRFVGENMGQGMLDRVAGRLKVALRAAAVSGLLLPGSAPAQSIRVPWSDYAHDPQHTAISPVASQPLHRVIWQTSVDLSVPTNNTGELFIHYGSPLITRSNTVIVPVKTTSAGGFRIESRVGGTGATNWMQSTDYILPSHNWTPSFSGTLTPKNRLCFPGGGGTVYYCDAPDTNGHPAFGQNAFYGLTNYNANTNAYLGSVFIDTPITSDRYGNIFFGFQVTGSTPIGLQSGIARIDYNGTGTWVSATNAASDAGISAVAMNCAPALSNDHKTLYVAVSSGYYGYGYLVALDSRTLTPFASVRLKDVLTPASDASMYGDSTASPTIGPDGDVYFGVVENPCCVNHDRGWLLHFDGALSQ